MDISVHSDSRARKIPLQSLAVIRLFEIFAPLIDEMSQLERNKIYFLNSPKP